MKQAYSWNDQAGHSQLFRLTVEGEYPEETRHYHVYRLSSELPLSHMGQPEENGEEHWALVLGPLTFPEPRDYVAEEVERLERLERESQETASLASTGEQPTHEETEPHGEGQPGPV